MKQKPDILSISVAAKTRLFTIESLELRFSNGREAAFERLRGLGNGAVFVIPLLDAETLLLVREYAAGIDRYELGFVKGRVDDGETPEAAADRELKEEIGYGARTLLPLRTVSLTPAYSTFRSHLMLAKDLYPEKLEGDEPEELEVVEWPLARIDALLDHPEVSDARVLLSVYLLRDFLAAEKRKVSPSTEADPGRLLPPVVAIARDAGRKILEVYEAEFDVETKGDGSPLTLADRCAHDLIEARLEALTPGIPVLSEESREIPVAERQQWRRYWLVDPLDGTKEFVKRNGEFTVNIALIENGEPVLGVVHAPVLDVTYRSARGTGAFRQEGDGEPEPIRVRPLDRRKVVMVASRSHAGEAVEAFRKRLEEVVDEVEITSMGSSLKICLVAEGKADIYPRLGPTSEWDTAAAQCVLECAGGRMTDTEGQPLCYNKESLLNPWFLAMGDDSFPWAELAGQ